MGHGSGLQLWRNAGGRASPGGRGSLRERLQAPVPALPGTRSSWSRARGAGHRAGEGCGGAGVVPAPRRGAEPPGRPPKGALVQGAGEGGGGRPKTPGCIRGEDPIAEGGQSRRAAGRRSERVCEPPRGARLLICRGQGDGRRVVLRNQGGPAPRSPATARELPEPAAGRALALLPGTWTSLGE